VTSSSNHYEKISRDCKVLKRLKWVLFDPLRSIQSKLMYMISSASKGNVSEFLQRYWRNLLWKWTFPFTFIHFPPRETCKDSAAFSFLQTRTMQYILGLTQAKLTPNLDRFIFFFTFTTFQCVILLSEHVKGLQSYKVHSKWSYSLNPCTLFLNFLICLNCSLHFNFRNIQTTISLSFK